MIVVDASALVLAVVDNPMRGVAVADAVSQGAVAPHLIDAELGHALRGLVRRAVISSDEALRSLHAGHHLVATRTGHRDLTARAWELRDNVSFYDALYVALAELRGLTLVTADGRLAAASGPRCPIEVV